MFIRLKRLLALVFLSVFIVSNLIFAGDDWQIIKVSGHDYLSVDNISKFYGLTAKIMPAGEKMQLETVRSPLEFVQSSREVMINGARCWLCFPVIEHEGKFLVTRTDLAKTIEPLLRPQRVQTPERVKPLLMDLGKEGNAKAALIGN